MQNVPIDVLCDEHSSEVEGELVIPGIKKREKLFIYTIFMLIAFLNITVQWSYGVDRIICFI